MVPVDRVRASLQRVMPGARADLERLVRIPSVSADPRAHGPNESLHLADFEKACLAEALLLARLGDAGLSRAR